MDVEARQLGGFDDQDAVASGSAGELGERRSENVSYRPVAANVGSLFRSACVEVSVALGNCRFIECRVAYRESQRRQQRNRCTKGCCKGRCGSGAVQKDRLLWRKAKWRRQASGKSLLRAGRI